MAELEETLNLDVGPALASVEEVDSALTSAASGFEAALSEAMSEVEGNELSVSFTGDTDDLADLFEELQELAEEEGLTVAIQGDTEEVIDALEEFRDDVESDEITIVVTGDEDSMGEIFDDLTEMAEDHEVEMTLSWENLEDVEDDIEDLSDIPVEVTITPDVEQVTEAIEEIEGEEIVVLLTGNDEDIEEILDELQQLADDQELTLEVDADLGPIEQALVELEGEMDSEPMSIRIVGDEDSIGDIFEDLDALASQADLLITVNGELANIESDLDALKEEWENTIEVRITGDTAEVEAALLEVESLADTLDATIVVSADVGDAESQISGLGDTASEASGEFQVMDNVIGGVTESLVDSGDKGSGSFNLLGNAAMSLSGKLNTTTGAAGEASTMLGGMGGSAAAAAGPVAIAVAAVAAYGGALYKFTEIGTEVIAINQQFETTFGDAAEAINTIDVSGLNISLDELAISLGQDDEALRAAATSTGALFQTFGIGQEEAGKFTEQLIAASAGIHSLNPAAGDLTTILGTLTSAIATGRTRGLKRLGIEITPEELDAYAASLGKTTKELTAVERATFLTGEITRQFGDVSDEVATRQENAGVKLAATKARFGELIETMAVEIAPPILDALEQFGPILKSLTPAFKIFGQVIAQTVKNNVFFLGLQIKIIAEVVGAFADLVSAAHDIPVIGRVVPDEWDDQLHDLEQGLHDSANSFHAAASGAGTLQTELHSGTDEATGFAGAISNLIPNALDDATAAAAEAEAAMQEEAIATEEAAAANEAFATTVAQTLPTAQAAIADFASEADSAWGDVVSASAEGGEAMDTAMGALVTATDPQRFVDNLQQQIADIRTWRDSLSTIAEAGLTRTLESLLAAGPEQGAGLAAALAKGIESGEPAIAEAAELSLAGLEQETDNTTSHVDLVWGPQIKDSLGRAAGEASTAWTENLTLEQYVDEETGKVSSSVQGWAPEIADSIVASAATRATDRWNENFGIAEGAAEETRATGPAITRNVPTDEAGDAGEETSDEFVGGYDPKTGIGTATAAVDSVFGENGLRTLMAVARGGGTMVGDKFAEGFERGIEVGIPGVEQAASRMATRAVAAAEAKLKIHSPSQVMYDIGRNTGSGLAAGITASTAEVAAASSALFTAGSGQYTVRGSNAVVGNAIFNIEVNLASGSPSEAAAAGRILADSAQRALARRGVIAAVRAGGGP